MDGATGATLLPGRRARVGPFWPVWALSYVSSTTIRASRLQRDILSTSVSIDQGPLASVQGKTDGVHCNSSNSSELQCLPIPARKVGGDHESTS